MTQEEEDKASKVPYDLTIGSLIYAMVCTRLDIVDVVGVVSRYMSYPGLEHWNTIKWTLRYFKGTYSKCLYFGGSTTSLQCYVDLYLVRDIDTQ